MIDIVPQTIIESSRPVIMLTSPYLFESWNAFPVFTAKDFLILQLLSWAGRSAVINVKKNNPEINL
jgi:hypothetical protein